MGSYEEIHSGRKFQVGNSGIHQNSFFYTSSLDIDYSEGIAQLCSGKQHRSVYPCGDHGGRC